MKAAVQPVDETTKISTVKQNTFTEFTVTMSKALEKVAAADFTMVRDNDNQVISIKSATLDDKDKTQVKLVVYTSLTDAKTYTVTYTAADEAKTQSTAQVTVTDGIVADVAITPLEITANKETLIEYQTLDANGVIISQKGAASKAENNVDVEWTSLLGTMDNDTSKYILYNIGDTAEFTVTYHTYKYDTTTGAETGVITKKFIVTAVKDASVISQYTYTAALTRPYDWSKVTPKQAIAVDDTGSKLRKAWFLIKDAKGNDVTLSCGYTVESSDNSILVADGKVDEGVALEPVAKGSAYLMIKDTNGNVVNTMPITVGDKRTLATFKLSAPSVNVVTSAAFSTANAVTTAAVCAYTEITAKDQYGDDITLSDIDLKDKISGTDVAEPTLLGDNKTIRITGENKGKGSGTYIIKGTDALGKSMTTSLRVNSVEPTGTTTYSVVFVENNSTAADTRVVSTIDTTISETKAAAVTEQKLTAVIVEKKGGVVIAACEDATKGVDSVKVTKNDGTVLLNAASKAGVAKTTSSAAIATSIAEKVTPAALSGKNAELEITARTSGTSEVSKYLDPGTYTVVYELIGTNNKTDKASASFTVTDTQSPVTANVKVTDFGNEGGGSINSYLLQDKYVEYYYGQVKTTPTGFATVSAPFVVKTVDYTKTNGDKNAFVKSVMIVVPVADTGNTMVVKVPINKTFVTTGAQWS